MTYTFRVGVIIPNFNDGVYLPECLKSVLNQTVPFDEIVFVDDASTDQSVNIYFEKTHNCPQARLVRLEKNMGTINAINKGIEVCGCDYALFLSANDSISIHLVQRLKETLVKETGIWSALCYNKNVSGESLGFRRTPVISHHPRYFSPIEVKSLVDRYTNWLTGTTMFFNLHLVRQQGGLRHELEALADWLLGVELSFCQGCFFVPEVLGYVTLHQKSYLSRSFNQANTLHAATRHWLDHNDWGGHMTSTMKAKIMLRIDINTVIQSVPDEESFHFFKSLRRLISIIPFCWRILYHYNFDLLYLVWSKTIALLTVKNPYHD